MKNPTCIKIAALLLALSFIEPRVACADAMKDAADATAEIDKANQEAEGTIPNGSLKPGEDALDAAARANGDNPTAANATAEKTAQTSADKESADWGGLGPSGKDQADKAKAYREALKKRREARKKLKKALGDLLAQRGNARQGIMSPSPELEDAIKKAQKALGESEKTPQRPKPKTAENAAQPTTGETCAVLIATGKITVETSGTGETIGHIADLKIQNLTDQPLTCAIAPMILESGSGKNQHYACPTGQTVALNPHQAKTVPMNGVCLNRNKPPVGKGVSGDLVINEANPSGPQNPNSHIAANQAGDLLRICAAKYTAADQLQKSGALKALPYKDRQKQKDIVVQWSTWCDPRIAQITGAPPATKEDLRKVVYKQAEAKGPVSPETKKKLDQGIDTIFEKVELTTAKAKDLEKPEQGIPAVARPEAPETPVVGQPSPRVPGTTTTESTTPPQIPATTASRPAGNECKCEKLEFGLGKDKPDSKLEGKGPYTYTYRLPLKATITCQTETGEVVRECSASLSVDKSWSFWVNKRKGTQFKPTSESFTVEPEKTCRGKCDGKPADTYLTVVYKAELPAGTEFPASLFVFVKVKGDCDGKPVEKGFGSGDVTVDTNNSQPPPPKPACLCDRLEFSKLDEKAHVEASIKGGKEDLYHVTAEIPFEAILTCKMVEELKNQLCFGKINASVKSDWKGSGVPGHPEVAPTVKVKNERIDVRHYLAAKCDGTPRKSNQTLSYEVDLTGHLSFTGDISIELKGEECASNGGLNITLSVEFDHVGKPRPSQVKVNSDVVAPK